MHPSEQTNKQYKFLLIALLITVCVMSVLGIMAYRYVSGSSSNADTHTAATQIVSNTIDTIDAAALQATLTPFPPLSDSLEVPAPTQSSDSSVATLTATPIAAVTLNVPLATKTQIAWVEERIASMTLAQKVGQMILTGVNGTVLTSDTCQFVQRLSIGGIVYLSSNISGPTPDQLAALSDGLQNCIAGSVGIPLFIAIDHEGLYVDRFPYDSPMTTFPPALAIGATSNPKIAYQAALAGGVELRANGVNMVLGPVADVLTDYDNTVISQRAYGGDPQTAGGFVGEAVRGYLDAGVIPVLKHYPGHGEVPGDSHTVLPVDNADLNRLLTAHLVPFQSGIISGAPGVMTSHVAFPAIDPENMPASLSAPLYRLLRDDLGFQGIAMSDSMGMGAVGSTGLGIPDASVAAVNAGLDMLLLVSPDLAETVYNRILLAAQQGEISQERINQAVRHILTVKYEQDLFSFPLATANPPDWNANANLAYQIGYQSVSVYKDDNNLVPIPGSVQDILVVGPADGWGLYPLLRTTLDQQGIAYNILTYSGYWYGPVPETNYLQIVPARAANYDLVIVFTWDSHPNRFLFDDTFQGQLVNTILDGGYPTIVIALKSPADILDFPGVAAYLSTIGTTRGQLHAVVDILVGKTSPAGTIPLPGLP